MALYESTFIVRQDVSPQEVDKVTENFEKVLGKFKAKLVRKEFWGLRSLAYKVKKCKKGYYTMLCVDASAEAIDELQRQYKLSEDVIRSLTVKVEEFDKEPSALVKGSDSKK
ncbi:30S ribosomal protein S6 [Rickettsiales bacterium]|nr:30S ribosomal protein S6 [Rickettsiales bacterium]